MTPEPPAGGVLSRLTQLEKTTQTILDRMDRAEQERKTDRRFQIASVLGATGLVISAMALLLDKL